MWPGYCQLFPSDSGTEELEGLQKEREPERSEKNKSVISTQKYTFCTNHTAGSHHVFHA